MGEWFRIMEHFWQFSLCNVVILPSVEFWVQLWHICAGLIPRHWQAPIGFVWSESNGSPFLVVGVVSQVRRAVLRSFVPGLQLCVPLCVFLRVCSSMCVPLCVFPCVCSRVCVPMCVFPCVCPQNSLPELGEKSGRGRITI